MSLSKEEAKGIYKAFKDFYGNEDTIPVGDLAAAFQIPEAEVPEFLFTLKASEEKSQKRPVGRPPKKAQQEVLPPKPAEQPPPIAVSTPKLPQSVVVSKPIAVKKDHTTAILRWPMLAFAAIAVVLSCYFTIDWLGNQQPKLIAWLMGITLIGFGMMSFQISSFTRSKGHPWVGLAFLTAWVFLTSWSITNTVSSLYTHYTARQEKRTSQDSVILANKAVYDSLKAEETEIIFRNQNKKEDVEKYRERARQYEANGDITSKEYRNTIWLVSVREKELVSIADELKKKRAEIQEQLKKDSTVAAETKSLQHNEFFGWMAGIFKMNADLLQFIVMCVPAVILDIIASASLYIFLFLEKMVDVRKDKK